MPSRKITERERLTLYARQASDDELDQALEILRIEARIRAGQKGTANKPKKAASRKVENNTPPGPPNPPKPANDNPQG